MSRARGGQPWDMVAYAREPAAHTRCRPADDLLTTLAPDTELAPAGRTVRAGDKVAVRHASADRDERAFA
ncbi:hypothetical protein [Streptomyces shenzhenensis]|uniref:hypothetical protein n=1 Tax=Streptomyces shenzhenensis TaxID=943815 RepID=UPI003689F52C